VVCVGVVIAACQHKDKCPPPNEGEALRAKSKLSRWSVQARKANLEPWHPSHVKACANNELDGALWFLNVWPKNSPLKQTRIAYTCNSYRCPSAQCQRKAAHTDFARIKVALEETTTEEGETLDPSGFVFFVLTIDQHNTFKTLEKPYKNEQEAFKRLSSNTRFFLRRLRRRQKSRGERILGSEWVGTVEVQRNGWPHINLIVYAPELAEELREAQAIGPHDPAGRRHRAQIVDPWLLDAVTSTNWGTISTAEAVKDRDAMAGYIVKLGGEFGRTSGEIAKITQAPTNARMKLRRIRAGKGFLPPQRTDKGFTGVMMRRRTMWGVLTVGPMLEPDQVRPVGETEEEQRENFERYALGVREAMRIERAQLQQDQILTELAASGPVGGHLSRLVRASKNREIRLIR